MTTYKVIKGTFHVKGYAPDGDSIRFKAENKKHWQFFDWNTASNAKDNTHQLRIEAIDALETHYEGARQPHAFAVAALERMLELIGITEVEYNLLVTKITAANDGKPGFIVSAGVDKFDRPVSFVFSESAPLTDGAEISAEEIPFMFSINYELVREAIVYPTFYTTMDAVIVQTFRDLTRQVRGNKQGLWAIDRTGGFRLLNPATIQEDVIILPKFFRRLIAFFERSSTMTGFKEYLKRNKEKVVVNGTETTFDALVEVKGNFYRLNALPEDMLFVP